MQHIISLVGENVSHFFQGENPLFKAIYRHFNSKRVTYNLHDIRLPCSQILILQNPPKILSFHAQPTTQIAWASAEKQNNLNQFCRVASEGASVFAPFGLQQTDAGSQGHRFITLSIRPCWLHYSRTGKGRVSALPRAPTRRYQRNGDAPRRPSRWIKQSSESRRQEASKTCQDEKWDLKHFFWVWHGGYNSIQKGQGTQVTLRIEIEMKSKGNAKQDRGDCKVSKSVKEPFTQATCVTEMHNVCSSQVAISSHTCMIIMVSSSLTRDTW